LSALNANLKKANLTTDKHGWHGLKIQNGFYRTFFDPCKLAYLWRGLGFLQSSMGLSTCNYFSPRNKTACFAAGGEYFVFLCVLWVKS
jgi:hypothetical protein